MASTLTLDRSDPGVDELVSNWEDGGTYRCEVTIVQTKSSPNAATYDLTEISEIGGGEEEVEEEVPAAAPASNPKPKPAVSVKY